MKSEFVSENLRSVYDIWQWTSSFSFSFSSYRGVRPINDLFLPHDYIRTVVSLIVVQVFFFR
jgi:hypothetical protein